MAQYGKFSTSIFEQFPASIKKYFSLEGRLGRLGTSEVTIPGTPKSRHIMARLIILSASSFTFTLPYLDTFHEVSMSANVKFMTKIFTTPLKMASSSGPLLLLRILQPAKITPQKRMSFCCLFNIWGNVHTDGRGRKVQTLPVV